MTDAERHRLLLELFDQAVDLDPAERDEFVAGSECSDEIRQELAGLLASFDASDGMLEKPLVQFIVGDGQIDRDFGSYRIVREIGHGGMGAVYLGERRDGEIRHRVAIKILRQTIRESEIERRFLDERQILATLQHPNIAAFVDGGVSDTGEPFIAMEYVDGSPITDFCNEKSLSVRDRLRLFLKVCKAVAHAHRNLVIHRDIKPTNIIVSREGEPKLLDFGLAKLVGIQNDEVTRTVFRALTPGYASPEQLRGDKITTATDVYSLGVVLYEILTGRRPIETDNKSFEEIVKSVLDEEPFVPSRVAPPVADRSIHFGSRIAADLDNIVLMALRKEPDRRYASVDELAKDIENFLDGKPVNARSNTFLYRAGKLIARNRVAAAMILVLTISLIAGLIAAVYQYRRADAERIRFEQQSAKSQKIARFMEKVLNYANPAWYAEGRDQGGSARLIEVIDALSGKIDAEFPDDPDVQAEVHYKFAEIYQAKRSREHSYFHARRAWEVGRRAFGDRSPQTAKYLYYLAAATFARNEINEGLRFSEEAIAIFRETDPENANLPYLLEDTAGQYLANRERPDRARELLRESQEIFRKRDGEKHFNSIRLFGKLAFLEAIDGNRERAHELLAEYRRRMKELGDPVLEWRTNAEVVDVYGALGETDLLRTAAHILKSPVPASVTLEEFLNLLWTVDGQLSANECFTDMVELAEFGEKRGTALRPLSPEERFEFDGALALGYAETGRRAEALKRLANAMEFRPGIDPESDWGTMVLYVRVYELLGETNAAREMAEKAAPYVTRNLPARSLQRVRLEEILERLKIKQK